MDKEHLKYKIHIVCENDKQLYSTDTIEFIQYGWLKIKDAYLWHDGVGDWSDNRFTRIFPSNRVLWIDEEF